ncbi:MAG: acetate kinase [Actinomycetia bacterium]|nr:acetate kinase [Actinomycetes bacterium]
MYILVINAGSSSLKYQLVDQDTRQIIDKGLCEKIGLTGSFLQHGPHGGERTVHLYLPDHYAAISAVLAALSAADGGVLQSLTDIVAVGHRVVHGGEYFSSSVVIDEDVISRIEECVNLAPLHNPPALVGIRACQGLIPEALEVAVFDTAFHQTMPAAAYMYPLPYDLYEHLAIRRYGFHGTSHRYVAGRAAAFLQRDPADLKLITCHLGNGCSIAAIDGGRSVDTSMGLTPLEGLMMGTRSGSVDPTVIPFLMHARGLSVEETVDILNRKSGLMGVSGVSSDLRDVLTAASDGSGRAKLALDMFAYTVKRYIGQYSFVLGRVDAVVMTAGIGERSAEMRRRVFAHLENFGMVLDENRNNSGSGEREISAPDSPVKLLVIPTDEEGVIVSDVLTILADRQDPAPGDSLQP